MDDVTRILDELGRGDESAADRLMPLVYDRLRALAAGYFQGQPAAHTLQPTALVHEAYLKMVDQRRARWRDRAHFLAVCALAMRGILVDHARSKAAERHGGKRRRVTLSAVDRAGKADSPGIDMLDLEEALVQLARLNERQARIVDYRFFGGMSVGEVALKLGVSERTVAGDWRMARAWLQARLGDGSEPGGHDGP